MSGGAHNEYPVSWARVAIAIAVVAAIGFLAWYLLIRDDDGSGSVPQAGEGPVLASEDSLSSLQDELGHPVYWAGPPNGRKLEATLTEDGQVYVRYLAEDAEVGVPDPAFLTVATYPLEDAERTLRALADEKGSGGGETPDGALVVTTRDRPTNVYFAPPGEGLQIEVFDPDPTTAFTLASGGEIVPVD